jgi:hypothetical protein
MLLKLGPQASLFEYSNLPTILLECLIDRRVNSLCLDSSCDVSVGVRKRLPLRE